MRARDGRNPLVYIIIIMNLCQPAAKWKSSVTEMPNMVTLSFAVRGLEKKERRMMRGRKRTYGGGGRGEGQRGGVF